MPFTPEQHSAIVATNRELLVSAAAGSGKTAVLVERILHMLCNWGIGIDQMLVVTYTRAAAAELRERLETRIAEAAKEWPTLQKQAELVNGAQISTIHSYCQHVVREHFRDCGIDPQFTVGDERTLQTLYRESLEDTLDSIYTEQKTDQELRALLQRFSEKEVVQLLETLYRFLISRPSPLEWLDEQAEKEWRADDIDEAPLALAFVNEAGLTVEGAMAEWEKARRLRADPAFPQALAQTLEADLDTLKTLYEACGGGMTAVVKAFAQCRFVTLARTKPTTSDEIACVDRFKEIRAGIKKNIEDVRKRVPNGLESMVEDMRRMQPSMRGLAKAVRRLLEGFAQRKREQATLDFNDLEHLTLGLIKNPEICAMEAARFDAVFVDEYQDVSEIQEAILNALKRPTDSERKQYYFYVGDVKQSIYRFRLAEPALFLGKLETFSTEEDAPLQKIILNRNFRSREGVLSAVNRIFLHLMDKRVTEIDYNREAMLYAGFPSQNDPLTELHVLSSKGLKPMEAATAEAELIAGDILRTVGMPVYSAEGEPCGMLRFKDIAVLLPVVKNVADKVEAALMRAGIPVYTDAAANAFAGEEAVSVAQHLMLLDNLKNDMALIAELRSPLFEMSEGELAQIRLCKPEKEASFLEALQSAAANIADGGEENSLSARCKAALEMLKEERFLYRSMQPDEYLWDFLMRSGLYAHYGAQPGGKLRQANLRMLCQKAGEYFAQHRDGLQGFLESIQSGAAGDSSSPTIINPWEDVVRIMSIHKSKGLEFPTVYVMGMGGSIARRRQTKMISMHAKLGVGLMYRNAEARTKRQTLLQGAIDLREAAQERAERARVLYVAATRPKNRLVLIGSTASETGGAEALAASAAERAQGMNDLAAVRSAGTYLDWLLQCVQPEDWMEDANDSGESTNPLWKIDAGKKFPYDPTCFPQKTGVWRVLFHRGIEKSRDSQTVLNVNRESLEILSDLLKQPVQAQKEQSAADGGCDPLSPMPELVHLPLKLGVTALCRSLSETGRESAGRAASQSEETDAEETPDSKRRPIVLQRPRLLGAVPREPEFMTARVENAGVLRGTATHKALCALSLDGVRERLASLVPYIREQTASMTLKGKLTREEGRLVNAEGIAAFFLSETGERVLRSPEVHREWSFNLRVRDPFETILQGVIDLCFLEDGRWVLIDFKTDRVQSAEELWKQYEMQLSYYRQALERATAHPVGECGLYALSVGQYSFRKQHCSGNSPA